MLQKDYLQPFFYNELFDFVNSLGEVHFFQLIDVPWDGVDVVEP